MGIIIRTTTLASSSIFLEGFPWSKRLSRMNRVHEQSHYEWWDINGHNCTEYAHYFYTSKVIALPRPKTTMQSTGHVSELSARDLF